MLCRRIFWFKSSHDIVCYAELISAAADTGSSPVPATKESDPKDRFLRFMPFYVYILWSASLRKTYVGFTANLDARLHAHNNGVKGWTLRGRPWILINSEIFNEKKHEAILSGQDMGGWVQSGHEEGFYC